MRIDDERDLRERLDEAFEVITPHPAPVDGAVRRGRAIRVRRRVALAVGLGVVAAAGAFAVPSLLHRTASARLESPGNTHYTVTVQTPGRHAQRGLIASGTVNGKRWEVLAAQPGADGAGAGYQDIKAVGPVFGPDGVDQYIPAPLAAGKQDPVSFTALSSGPAQAQLGAVRSDVSYVTVRLSNGHTLTVRPVTLYGTRYVAFALPTGAAIIDITAYSRHGEIAFAVPFNQPGGMAVVVAWLRPGQHQAARDAGVIGSGTFGGVAWSATVYIGPWGTCIEAAGGQGRVGSCSPAYPAGTTITTVATLGTPDVVGGIAADSVVRIVITRPDGTTAEVWPVTVGGRKFFAFATDRRTNPLRWVAYDGAGKVVASSAR